MIELLIGSEKYTKFLSISITKSIENIATGFTVSFVGKLDFEADTEITIKKDDVILVVGLIEVIDRSESTGITTTIRGRSKSGQLIGGSIFGESEYKNKKVNYILKKIIGLYDIDIAFVGDMGNPIDKFTIEPSEDPYSAIVRLLKLRNLIAFDENGMLTVRESSDVTYSDTISRDNFNISSSENFSNLFSEYTVVGNGDQRNITYTANNYLVSKYRPKKIIAETKIDKDTAKKMAEFELQKAIGKSKTGRVDGYSWNQPNGELWKINSISPVESENTNLIKNMLISTVDYNYSNAGETISISLVGENTFV